MYSFTNNTTFEQYARYKQYFDFTFASVPNTAAGFDSCRKIVKIGCYDYTIGCNTEVSYWLSCKADGHNLFINWKMTGNFIEIESATDNGRHFTAAKYLKKYAKLICEMASCVKYDGILQFKPYTSEIAAAFKNINNG